MSKSIVTDYKEICFFCGRRAEGEHHLIFGTAGIASVLRIMILLIV